MTPCPSLSVLGIFQGQPATFSLPTCFPCHIRLLTLGTWATHPLPGICHTLPLVLIMVGQLGPVFSIREIPDPTKFQIPLPYLAPFCLAFDGLPKVGGRPPHPQRDYYPPPSSLGVSRAYIMTRTHRLFIQRAKNSRDFGRAGRGRQWARPEQASSIVESLSHLTLSEMKLSLRQITVSH